MALALAGWLFLIPLVNQAVVTLAWATTASGQDLASYTRQAYAFERPSGLLAAGLAIAAHAVSNVYTYVSGALASSVAAVRATQEIGWLGAASDVGVFAVFTVAALAVARRMSLRRRVALTADPEVSAARRTPPPRPRSSAPGRPGR